MNSRLSAISTLHLGLQVHGIYQPYHHGNQHDSQTIACTLSSKSKRAGLIQCSSDSSNTAIHCMPQDMSILAGAATVAAGAVSKAATPSMSNIDRRRHAPFPTFQSVELLPGRREAVEEVHQQPHRAAAAAGRHVHIISPGPHALIDEPACASRRQ